MVTKLDQLKAYVEPQVTKAVQSYADEHGLTKSQATRHLTLLGLRLERKRKKVIEEAERALEAPAEQSPQAQAS